MNTTVKHCVILAILCFIFSINETRASYADVWVNPVQNVIAVRAYFPAGPTWSDQTCLALYAVQGAQSFVTFAWYGNPAAGKSIGNGRYDVTKILNTTIEQQKGSLTLTAGIAAYNALFGNPTGDATVKTLSIVFANGTTKTYANYPAVSLTSADISAFNYMTLQGQSLSLITVIPGDFNTAAWSSDGNYIAIGGGMNMRSGPDCGFLNKDKLRIYRFTGTSLIPMASADYPAQYDGGILSISWQPGSSSPYHLAVVGIVVITRNSSYFLNPGISPLETFTFTPSTPSLTLQYSYPSYSTGSFYQVAWSPNGSYIATTSYDYRTGVLAGYDILHNPIYVSGNFAYLQIHNPASATLANITEAGPIANVGSTTYGYQPLMAFAWSSASDRIGISLQGMSNIHACTYIYSWNGSALAFNSAVGFKGSILVYENGQWSRISTTQSYEYGVLNVGGQAWNGALAWNHDDTRLAMYTGFYNDREGIFSPLNHNPIRVYNYTKGSPDSLTANVSVPINHATDGTILQPVYAGTVGWGPADRFLAVGTYGALANDRSGFGTHANADMRTYGWQFTNVLPLISYGYGTGGQGTITAMAWSSDGLYLAVGGVNAATTEDFSTAYQVRIYQLVDGLTLVPITGFNYGATVNALAWNVYNSYYYLTVGGSAPGDDGIGEINNSDALRMYNFNGSAVSAYSSVAFSGSINSLEWTNNQYLAVGGTSGTLAIFDIVGGALHQFVTRAMPSSAPIYALSWSNWQTTGAYLALAATYSGGTGELTGCNIYWLDSVNAMITFIASYNSSTTVSNIVWDKTIVVSPYTIAIALTSGGARLFKILQFNGSSLSLVQSTNACQGGNPLVMAWATVAGNRYLVANAQNTPYDVQFLNNLYLYYSLSYGTGLQSIAFNPMDTHIFALGGTNPTNDSFATGFANTNELRLYSVPGINFLPLTSQSYGNTINTNDFVRSESGLSLAIPNAYTLTSGEGITGAVDIGNSLTSLTTTPPLPILAISQSLHDGDLDLTQGCIQLDGSLRLGPGSNILTSTQAPPRGGLYLNNQTLFLQGDTTLSTTITDFQTAVQFLSQGTVDGLGNNLSISGPVIVITGGTAPTIFKNMTFTNLWNNGYWYGLYDETLQGIILENVTFLTSPGQVVTLATPLLTIRGMCNVRGGGTLSLATGNYTRTIIYAESAWYTYQGQQYDGGLDVTDMINTMIINGATSVTASPLVFGGDPLPGFEKILEITFSNGQFLFCADGGRIVFPQEPLTINPVPAQLPVNVTSALYGNPATTDVTSFVNNLFTKQGGSFAITARDEVITGTMSSFTYTATNFTAGQHAYFWNGGWPLLTGAGVWAGDTLWTKFHAVGTQNITIAFANVADINVSTNIMSNANSYLVDIGGPTNTSSMIWKGNPDTSFTVKHYHANPTQILDGNNALVESNGGNYWASINPVSKEISWGKGTTVGLDPKQTWTDANLLSGINRVGFCSSANAIFSNISIGNGSDLSSYTFNRPVAESYFPNGGWALSGATNDVKWVRFAANPNISAYVTFTNHSNISASNLVMSNANAYIFVKKSGGYIGKGQSSVSLTNLTGNVFVYQVAAFWASVQQVSTTQVILQWGYGWTIGQQVLQTYTDSNNPVLNIDRITFSGDSGVVGAFSDIQVGYGPDPGKKLVLSFSNNTNETLYQNQSLVLSPLQVTVLNPFSIVSGPVPPSINIASGGKLYVGQGTTLQASAITFEDSTSTLLLDGATLLNTSATGPLHLTKGTLNYNGLVTLSSLHNSRFVIGNGISEANDLHIFGQAASTLKFDQNSSCTGKSTCWYRNVH